MKERRKSQPKNSIHYDEEFQTFQAIEGLRFVGARCSICEDYWRVSDELKLPFQFLKRFSQHANEKHPLDSSASLLFLYVNTNKKSGPTQNTHYQESWHSSGEIK